MNAQGKRSSKLHGDGDDESFSDKDRKPSEEVEVAPKISTVTPSPPNKGLVIEEQVERGTPYTKSKKRTANFEELYFPIPDEPEGSDPATPIGDAPATYILIDTLASMHLNDLVVKRPRVQDNIDIEVKWPSPAAESMRDDGASGSTCPSRDGPSKDPATTVEDPPATSTVATVLASALLDDREVKKEKNIIGIDVRPKAGSPATAAAPAGVAYPDDDDDWTTGNMDSNMSSSEYSFSSSDGENDGFIKCGRPSSLSKAFDMDLLVGSIERGEPALERAVGRDVVLVVGKTGTGKSTLIQGLAGRCIRPTVHKSQGCGRTVEKRVYEASNALPGFEIGHVKTSMTRHINCYERRLDDGWVSGEESQKGGDGGLVYIDSP